MSPAPDLTERPRKYGFHGTIKAPFRPNMDASEQEISDALEAFCAQYQPIALRSLRLSRLGRFFALTAPEEAEQINSVAASAVRDLDRYRAAATDAELARRKMSRLSERQTELLLQWGYPYVMDQFRFHLTLTGPTKDPDAAQAVLQAALDPMLQQPMHLESLSLLGEATDGLFHQIARFALNA